MNETEYKVVNRGEIFYMSFGSTVGSEQQKSRPVVIVSNDDCNWHSPVVTVLPITSKDKKPLPTHTQVPEGLPVRGIVMAEQIQTVSKSRLGDYVGEFDDKTMRKLDEAICVQCAIERKRSQETQMSSEKDALIDELRNKLLAAQNKLNFAEQETSDNDIVVKDLQQKLATMTERAKIFEQLYKEEVLKACNKR